MRVATIDIGTNSVLLLIAERRGVELSAVLERATITRLGQGVDATRALAPEAVERTLACLSRYAEDIRAAGVQRVDAVGTSAMRDARGGESFVARATEILGVAPRVISGEEEARLTFTGSLTGLNLAPGPVVVFDVGGGSTEIIVGDAAGAVHSAVSLDIGSVRLTERHVREDPIGEDELRAIRADVRATLTKAPPLDQAVKDSRSGVGDKGSTGDEDRSEHEGEGGPGGVRLVGVAGTVTTLAALVRGITPYDGACVHGAKLTKDEIASSVARLAPLSLQERRSLPALDPARADVIVAGGTLVEEILSWAQSQTLIASDRGVRWGLAETLTSGSSDDSSS